MNGKLGRMREVVEMQKIRIDYLVDMNMENDTDTSEDQQERRNKIKDLKESNAKFEIDIKDTTAKLMQVNTNMRRYKNILLIDRNTSMIYREENQDLRNGMRIKGRLWLMTEQ